MFDSFTSAVLHNSYSYQVNRYVNDVSILDVGISDFNNMNIKVCSIRTFKYIDSKCIFTLTIQHRSHVNDRGFAYGTLCLQVDSPKTFSSAIIKGNDSMFYARKENTICISLSTDVPIDPTTDIIVLTIPSPLTISR